MVVDVYNYLFRNYITYDRLYHLSMRAFYTYPEINALNVFIDAHSLVSSMYNESIQFTYEDYNPIAASMINLCGHLREYFHSRHHVWTKFFIVCGRSRPDYVRNIIPEYNAHTVMREDSNTVISNLIYENMALLKFVCSYLPDIVFLDGENLESAYLINTVEKEPEKYKCLNGPYVIYSRDSFQYVSIAKMPYTTMYRPKKYRGEDRSYIVNKTNLLESYLVNELKAKWKDDLPIDYTNFIRTIRYAGIDSRGVKGVMKFKKASNLEVYPHFFTANEENIIKGLSIAFDLDAGSDMYRRSLDYTMFNREPEIFQKEEIQDLNNKFFTVYPLELNSL